MKNEIGHRDIDKGFSKLGEGKEVYNYKIRYYAPPTFISRDPHFERYPTFSPYCYTFNNPLRFIDPTGKDGEIAVDADAKTVTVRANFYYNSSQLEQGGSVSIQNGFQAALDSWSNDIKASISGMDGFDDYSVDVQFNMINVDIGNATGTDAINMIQAAASVDPIGNSIVHDETVSSSAVVVGNKHLSANMTKAATDRFVFFGTEDIQGTAKHEIGHLFGLRDRYNQNNSEHAPYIKGDLMTSDYPRGNAVAPFMRVMNNNGIRPDKNSRVLINKNNRESR
jgi:RHS repeat-associated protein